MPEKQSPCLSENCSWCCNPVKIGPRSKHTPNELKIPTDKNGNSLWTKRDETLLPEKDFETQVVDTYDCKNFNEETGLCADYENRPEICRNTSCVSDNTIEKTDEQRKKYVGTKFFRIKK